MEARNRVYFTDLRTRSGINLYQKIALLFDRAGFGENIQEKDLTGVKLHFGERGGSAFLRPIFIRPIVEKVRQSGGKPFLVDTNTLYTGARNNSSDHLLLAAEHGFNPMVTGAPLLIGDGLRGQSFQEVEIDGNHIKKAHIASDIAHCDSLIGVAHFKLHLGVGFGGAIKNIGMGCASIAGKLAQHSNVRPWIKDKLCTGCRRCLDYCLPGAIEIKEEKAFIIEEKCTGCGECILICPLRAVRVKWDAVSRDLQERMVEYLWAVTRGKEGRMGYFNFLLNITPDCDCFDRSDAPLVPDIGILASQDPVAIDQASVDLLNGSQGLENSALNENLGPGEDKIKDIYPEIDYGVQLAYGEKLGLGKREYELVRV